MIFRVLATAFLGALWGWSNLMLASSASTLVLGQVAGHQFDNSDTSFLAVNGIFGMVPHLTSIISIVFVLILIGLWSGPIWKGIQKLKELDKMTGLGAIILGLALLGSASPSKAFYASTDAPEFVFILPHQSAFFIPDSGANQNSQAKFGSEEYYNSNKIAAKRFQIPHATLPPGPWAWAGKWAPVGRLILIDRTPFNREWVASAHRGTSSKDESFPCQSNEGLNISVGIAIGASLAEENSPRFLYKFGTKPVPGKADDPEVVFASIFYGRSLVEVMDGPVRSKIQSLVCDEFTKHKLDEANATAPTIMKSIETNTKAYMDTLGITLEYIGWADTFTFDKDVQEAINRTYAASQDTKRAALLAPQVQTLQGLAYADAIRDLSKKWNGAVPTSVSYWGGFQDLIASLFSTKATTK